MLLTWFEIICYQFHTAIHLLDYIKKQPFLPLLFDETTQPHQIKFLQSYSYAEAFDSLQAYETFTE